jgi:predicted flap endonuclease-1-like 5' DNA nuclease
VSKTKGLPWWAWVPFLPILLALLLLWRARRNKKPAMDSERYIPVDIHRDSIPIPMEPRYSDDLTIIKGIGLKSAGALHAAGIYTIADLSRTPVEELRAILLAGNLRLVDPASWPQQAAELMR